MRNICIPAVATVVAGLVALAPGVQASPDRTGQGTPARATADRSDSGPAYQIHLVYLVPADASDRGLDTNLQVHRSIDAMQRWLAANTDGLRWNMDTFRGRYDITFVRGKRNAAEYVNYTDVREELHAHGLDQRKSKKRYLVLLDGDTSRVGSCGEAEYPIYAPRVYAGQRNGALLGGEVAIVKVDSRVPACRDLDHGTLEAPGYFPLTMLHELIHTEGLVAPGAPHQCHETVLASHVCALSPLVFQDAAAALDPERNDVMFPVPTGPLSARTLDAGRDDYLGGASTTLRLDQSSYLLRRDGRNAGPTSRPQLPAGFYAHHDQ